MRVRQYGFFLLSVMAFFLSASLSHAAETKYALSRFPTQGSVGKTISLSTRLRANGIPIAGRNVKCVIENIVIGTSTTAADGIARFLYTIPINAVPSVKEVIFQYEEDTPRVYEAIATPLTILQGDTQISRFPVQGKAGKNVRVTARLRSGSLVIPNKALTFELNGSIIGSGTTGADGVVSIIFTIPADFAPGDKSITIRFGGDPSFKAVSGTTKLTVIP